MTTLFGLLWRCTVLGTVAAGAAFALRGLLILFGAPRRAFSLLWLAVVFRLLCPVGFAAPLSLLAAPPLQQTVAAVATLGPEGNGGDDLLAQNAPAEAASPLRNAAALVWLAGAAGLLGRGGWQYARLRRRVRFACRDENGCYTGEGVDTPFVMGVVRPRIYLPRGLTAQQTAFVLAHECAHLRALDTIKKPLLYLALCIHWFNPVVWLAFGAAVRDMELAADEAVLRTTDRKGAADYCQSLLTLALHGPARPCPVAFGEEGIGPRVHRALNYRAPKPLLTAVSVLLCAGLCVACAANPTTTTAKAKAAPAAFAESTTPAETPAPTNAAARFLWPVPEYTYVSRWMGSESSTVTMPDGTTSQAGSAHKGSDLIADEGTDILAMADGTVAAAEYNEGYGWYVTLTHADGYETLYAHCLDLTVAPGDTVKQGDVIAHVGNTGASSGDHCHVECALNGERFDLHELFPDK